MLSSRNKYFQEISAPCPPDFSLVTEDLFSAYYNEKGQSQGFAEAKRWYCKYLTHSFQENWKLVTLTVDGISATSTGPQTGDEVIITRLLLATTRNFSQDDIAVANIVDCLYNNGLFRQIIAESERKYATQLIFAIVGWLSFLYMPPVKIERETQESYTLSSSSTIRRRMKWGSERTYPERLGIDDQPLSYMFSKVGLLVPQTSMQTTDLQESIRSSRNSDVLFKRSLMRIHALTNFSNIKIKWVDTLIEHLEFNASEKELSIFRFPSYCLLFSLSDKPLIGERLLSYHFTARNFHQSEEQEHEISSIPKQFIDEVLLSYCLIFGSTKEQWRVLKTPTFVTPSGEDADPLLSMICADGWNNEEIRRVYGDCIDSDALPACYTTSHFPFFGRRLLDIQRYAKLRKTPLIVESIVELWNEKRNPQSWWSFWAVIVLSGLTLMLSAISVILEIAFASYQIYSAELPQKGTYEPQLLPQFPPLAQAPSPQIPPSANFFRQVLNMLGSNRENNYSRKVSAVFVIAVILDIMCLTLVAAVAYPEIRAKTDNNPECKLPYSKTKIHWKCNCGKFLEDAYVELVPGAAESLKSALQNELPAAPAHGDRDLESQAESSSSRTRRLGFNLLARWISSYTKGSQSETEGTKVHPPRGGITGNAGTYPAGPLFLLVCIEKPNGSLGLIQIDVAGIHSDQLLFACLRQHYLSIRGRWLPYLKFRRLEYINFVQFELWPSDEVDLQPYYDRRMLPPDARADEYLFDPPTTIPPIGPSRLMHLWKSPEHPDGDGRTCIGRFPKRRRERLYVSPGEKPATGWGIHLVEGLDWVLIWMMIFVVVLIGSLVFSVAFAVLEHDIQSAFAISSYVVSFVTLGIGACSICGQKIVSRHCR